MGWEMFWTGALVLAAFPISAAQQFSARPSGDVPGRYGSDPLTKRARGKSRSRVERIFTTEQGNGITGEIYGSSAGR